MAQSQDAQPLVKIFGRPGSALAYTLRDFLYRSDVPFEYIQLNSDKKARALVGVESARDSRLPVCVFPDGTRLETNVPGLFAAGDVRHNSMKRCASAVGEGAMAVMFVHRYLADG